METITTVLAAADVVRIVLITGIILLVFLPLWAFLPVKLARLRYFESAADEAETEARYRSAIGQIAIAVAAIPTFASAIAAFRERTEADFQAQYRYAFQSLNNQSSLASRLGGVLSLRDLAEKYPDSAAPIFEALALSATAASKQDRKERTTGPDAFFTLRRVADRAYICGDPELRMSSRCAEGASPPLGTCRVPGPHAVALCDRLRLSLRGGFFRGADARKAEFNGADLSEVDFSGAELERAQMYDASLLGARLDGANLTAAQMIEANISGATFCPGENLADRALMRDGIVGTQMASVDLDRAFATVAPAWFNKANLKDAQFVDARLPNARFLGAWAPGANFRLAHLSGAVFKEATLYQRSGSDGTLDELASFDGADLTDADFTGAQATTEQLARGRLCRTRMPDGSVAEPGCEAPRNSGAGDLGLDCPGRPTPVALGRSHP